MRCPSRGGWNGGSIPECLCFGDVGVPSTMCGIFEGLIWGLTFDELRGEEVVNGQLGARLGIPNLIDDTRPILKNETAVELWVLDSELEQVMTKVTAHVDEEGRFGLQALADTFRHGIEAFITPAAFSLTVSAHVVVELLCAFWALREPDKEWILGL